MDNNEMNNSVVKADKEEREIDLGQLLAALLSKWVIIVAAVLVCAVVSFGYFNFIVTPQYTSVTRIMVINRQSSDTITATDITSSTSLSKDYVEIVTSPSVLEQVIADLGLNLTTSQLDGKVSATVVTDTRMIRIGVTDKDPILAKKIADSIANVSSDKICKVMNIENMVSIIDEGSMPVTPSSPNVARNTIIAALLGLVVSCAIIIIVNITNDTIKTADDVEKYLGVSVLAVIPVFDNDNNTAKPGNARNVRSE